MRLTLAAATRPRLALLLASTLWLAGCSGILKMDNWKSLLVQEESLRSLSIYADAQVNDGYPLALDVVVVKDAVTLKALEGLRASEWFSGRKDLGRMHQGQLSVLSWELVPGQKFVNVEIPPEARPSVGVLVFADYPGESTYRAFVRDKRKVVVRLQQKDFLVTPE